MKKLLSVFGLLAGFSGVIAPMLTPINPKAAAVATAVGLVAAAAGESILKVKATLQAK